MRSFSLRPIVAPTLVVAFGVQLISPFTRADSSPTGDVETEVETEVESKVRCATRVANPATLTTCFIAVINPNGLDWDLLPPIDSPLGAVPAGVTATIHGKSAVGVRLPLDFAKVVYNALREAGDDALLVTGDHDAIMVRGDALHAELRRHTLTPTPRDQFTPDLPSVDAFLLEAGIEITLEPDEHHAVLFVLPR